MTMRNQRLVRVESIERVASQIKRFHFAPIDDAALPCFSAGAHVIVTMRKGDAVYRNPYSLMSSPLDPSALLYKRASGCGIARRFRPYA